MSNLKKGTELKASQLDDEASDGSSRPGDECPWPRPFPQGFDQCPVFTPLAFSPTDSRDRPLPEVMTCRHLVSRPFAQRKVGWYGACELGDPAARRAYLERKIVSVVKPGD